MRARSPTALLLLVSLGACASAERRPEAGDAKAAWLPAPPGTERDPRLEEAAALLCARDTDAVLDDDARTGAGLWEGRVGALLERGEPGRARARLQQSAATLAEEVGATHFGVAEVPTFDGVPCAALVMARRHARLARPLPARLPAPAPIALALHLEERYAGGAVYLLGPDGRVERQAVQGRAVDVSLRPFAGEGRYVLELIADGPADDPEVVLLWPLLVGQTRLPVSPRVLFPDEGHSDVGLTRRAESLVHQLRTQQELPQVSLSLALGRVAEARAQALADAGRLGHRLPEQESAKEQLVAREPAFPVARLSEVQAQAGTLAEAWQALTDSPAHRYELMQRDASHLGLFVVRGKDAFERPLITLVALLARRINTRPPAELRTELLGRMNLARLASNSAPLKRHPALDAAAQAHAEAMAKEGRVAMEAGGQPADERALALPPELSEVRAVIANLDDPLRLAPSRATLDSGAALAGIGLVPPGVDEQWYVCILVAAAP
jgi:uncharacterized protein YkwD